jgi:hypothetical protein
MSSLLRPQAHPSPLLGIRVVLDGRPCQAMNFPKGVFPLLTQQVADQPHELPGEQKSCVTLKSVRAS